MIMMMNTLTIVATVAALLTQTTVVAGIDCSTLDDAASCQTHDDCNWWEPPIGGDDDPMPAVCESVADDTADDYDDDDEADDTQTAGTTGMPKDCVFESVYGSPCHYSECDPDRMGDGDVCCAKIQEYCADTNPTDKGCSDINVKFNIQNDYGCDLSSDDKRCEQLPANQCPMLYCDKVDDDDINDPGLGSDDTDDTADGTTISSSTNPPETTDELLFPTDGNNTDGSGSGNLDDDIKETPDDAECILLSCETRENQLKCPIKCSPDPDDMNATTCKQKQKWCDSLQICIKKDGKCGKPNSKKKCVSKDTDVECDSVTDGAQVCEDLGYCTFLNGNCLYTYAADSYFCDERTDESSCTKTTSVPCNWVNGNCDDQLTTTALASTSEQESTTVKVNTLSPASSAPTKGPITSSPILEIIFNGDLDKLSPSARRQMKLKIKTQSKKRIRAADSLMDIVRVDLVSSQVSGSIIAHVLFPSDADIDDIQKLAKRVESKPISFEIDGTTYTSASAGTMLSLAPTTAPSSSPTPAPTPAPTPVPSRTPSAVPTFEPSPLPSISSSDSDTTQQSATTEVPATTSAPAVAPTPANIGGGDTKASGSDGNAVGTGTIIIIAAVITTLCIAAIIIACVVTQRSRSSGRSKLSNPERPNKTAYNNPSYEETTPVPATRSATEKTGGLKKVESMC